VHPNTENELFENQDNIDEDEDFGNEQDNS